MRQKIILLLLILLCFNFSSMAQQFEVGFINYNITSFTEPYTVEVINKEAYYSGDITIPSKVTFNDTTYSVTSIGDYAFFDCSKVKHITIPNSVTVIGNYAFCSNGFDTIIIPNSVNTIKENAFSFCLSLKSIILPNNIKTIDNGVFADCSALKSLIIPDSVTTIGNGAFANCSSLVSVILPNNETTIKKDAFVNCTYLDSIFIPKNIVKIESGAFSNCSSLKSITVDEENKDYIAQDDILYNKDKTILVQCAGKKVGDIIIPETVHTIDLEAFMNCKYITSVVMGNRVKLIKNFAFEECSKLEKVVIGDSVTTIGGYAFANCTLLKTLTIGKRIEYIDGCAFLNCNILTTITLPYSLDFINMYAFWGCNNLSTIYSLSENPSVIDLGYAAFPLPSDKRKLLVFCDKIEDYANSKWGKYFSVIESKNNILALSSNDETYGTTNHSGGEYKCEEEIHITATAKTGYHFVKWSDENTEISREIKVMRDISLMAIFAPNKYKLELYVNDTNFGAVIGEGVFDYNSLQSITAEAKKGYHFVKWSDGSNFNPKNVRISSDTSLTAIFEVNKYKLNLSSNDTNFGSVSGDGEFDYNTMTTISASSEDYYHFTKWSDENTDNPRDIIITSDTSLTAIFEVNQYILTVLSSDTTKGIVTGGGTFDYNTCQEIKAIAKEGYLFVSWNDGDTNSTRDIVVSKDSTFSANFIKKSSSDKMNVGLNEIKLYPNPAKNIVTIVIDNLYSNSKLSITDIQGRVIKTQNIKNKETKVDVSSFNKGIYFISVDNSIKKLIIE